jgi:methylthioribose-1-phosphate isomerase
MSNKKYLLIYGQFKDSFYRMLKEEKEIAGIFVLESRPNLEGAKEVCRKLLKLKITPTLICDNMAGFCFYQDKIKAVHLAQQKLARDYAVCKTGSLGLAICAKYHKIPVYLYPSAVLVKSHCKPEDIYYFAGKKVAPSGIKAYTSLIEQVPLKYISGVEEDGK